MRCLDNSHPPTDREVMKTRLITCVVAAALVICTRVDGSWTGNQTVPITGGASEWHQYVTWQAPTTIDLRSGAQTLTMRAAGGYYNARNITFTLEPPLTMSLGDIVFVSTRDGNPEIYSVKADGTNLIRLTNNPANDDAPVWSPDRQRIAFVSDRDGSPEIYVMNADGTNVVRRTFSASYSADPCWSADGDQIVYSTLSNGSVNIWTVSPDSGSPALLLENPGYDAHPALSPDGSRLAVTTDWYAYDFVHDVFIANADGTGWTGLTGNIFDHVDYVRPSWSPDSAKLAVAITQTTGIDQYNTQIGVMNADGSGLTPLISAAPWAKSSWSPDGTMIAFTSGSSGALNVSWVSATDGSQSGTIVTNGYSPDWGKPTTTVGFTVEAATFADGGQGCWQGPFYCGGGYYDETPGNWGDAQVRPGTDVDLWYDDGGIVIGGLDGLEWVTFPVNVPQSGEYRVTFRTASPADRPSGSGVVNVGIHGVAGSWVDNQIVPVTGGPGEWHTYVTWKAPGAIYLPAGPQTLTMWAAGGWYNVRNMTFTLEGAAPR